MRRVALISDTHGLLRPEVRRALAGVERILHLGDVEAPEILAALRALAPLHVVRGNVDHGAWAARLPATELLEVFGLQVYLIHNRDHLDLDPAAAGIGMVLYGHTHVPKEEVIDGVRYVNPGAAGPRRFRLPVSWAYLHEDHRVEFVTLGEEG